MDRGYFLLWRAANKQNKLTLLGSACQCFSVTRRCNQPCILSPTMMKDALAHTGAHRHQVEGGRDIHAQTYNMPGADAQAVELNPVRQ
jgi:hypothetical protein